MSKFLKRSRKNKAGTHILYHFLFFQGFLYLYTECVAGQRIITVIPRDIVKAKLQIPLGFGCTQEFALCCTPGFALYRSVTNSAEGVVSTGSYRTDVLMN